MADEYQNKSHEHEAAKVGDEVEAKDRGLFDFLGKKEEEKPQEEAIATEFEKVKVSETEPNHHHVEEHKHHEEEVKEHKHHEEEVKEHKKEEEKSTLLEKLHRSGSSSSSVSIIYIVSF